MDRKKRIREIIEVEGKKFNGRNANFMHLASTPLPKKGGASPRQIVRRVGFEGLG